MFEKLNTKVTYLKRIKFDIITLENLEIGKVRKLTEKEIEILKYLIVLKLIVVVLIFLFQKI